MDFRALLQNQWFQLCLLVALLSGGTTIFNLAQRTPTPPPTPAPPFVAPRPSPIPGPGPKPFPGPAFPPPAPIVGQQLKPKTPGRWIVDASGAADADSRALLPVIGSLSDGDVVTLRPGDYFGGIAVVKNVRFVGQEPLRPAENLIGGGERGGGSFGGATLHAQGMDTVFVNAKNVAFENLRIEQDTPGVQAAVRILGESKVEMSGCEVRTKSRFNCGVLGNATLEARESRFQNPSGNGAVLQFENNARGSLTGCTFSQSPRGCDVIQTAQARFTNCTFQNLGQPNGVGATLAVEGGQAQITASQCRFFNNTATILAKEGGSLTLTDCVLKNNGITGETGNSTLGLICAQASAKVTLRGDTFENNKQGVVVIKAGSLVLERCQMRGTGVATDNASVKPYCNSVGAGDQGSTVRIAGSTIADSFYSGVYISGGATLQAVESTVRNSNAAGLILGAANFGGSRAELNNVQFIENRNDGVWVNNGCTLDLQNCRLVNNGSIGVNAQNQGTEARLTNTIVSGSKAGGFDVYDNATGTANGCTFESNGSGVQAGDAGHEARRGTIALENCTVRGNRDFGVAARRGSEITLKGGYVGGQRQNILQERGGSVRY